jgi:hypothetical protein
MGGSASASAADTRAPQAAQAKKITVKVEGTSLTVDVNANGTFQLTGVPSGTFTLIFLSDGVEVGRVVVTAGDGSEVKIVVQVNGVQLIVVEIEIEDGTGSNTGPSNTGSCPSVNGGKVGQKIELEGNVASGSSASFDLSVNGRSGSPIKVNASSASFRCIGSAKTSSDAECKASVKTGAKVHVSGTLMTCTPAEVTATEVKVQKD